MTGVLRAELRKITTTRLWWIMLICIFVLGGGYAALPATIAVLEAGRPAPDHRSTTPASCAASTTAATACRGSWRW